MDDSIEIAVGFTREAGAFLQENSPKASATVFEHFRAVLNEGNISHHVQYMIEVLMQVRKDKYKDNPILPEGLDLVEEEEQITHEIQLEEDRKVEEGLSTYPISCTSLRGCSLLTDFFKAEIFHDAVMHSSLKRTAPPKRIAPPKPTTPPKLTTHPKPTTPRPPCVQPDVSKSADYCHKEKAHSSFGPKDVHSELDKKPYLYKGEHKLHCHIDKGTFETYSWPHCLKIFRLLLKEGGEVWSFYALLFRLLTERLRLNWWLSGVLTTWTVRVLSTRPFASSIAYGTNGMRGLLRHILVDI
jgi:hypothetical protein